MRPKIPESYHVRYSYYSCVSRRPPRGEEKCVETLATGALITDEKGNPVARGEAILSPDDVFSMRVAKDVALGRALKELETGIARGPMVTPSGRVVTDADFRALADEAERGYDPEELRSIRPCLLHHTWGGWFNLVGGPPYRQRRRCHVCHASETR